MDPERPFYIFALVAITYCTATSLARGFASLLRPASILLVTATLCQLFIGSAAHTLQHAATNVSSYGGAHPSLLDTVWINSGCSKAIFANQELPINVRKLDKPVVVAGLGSNRVVATHKGDYPLCLEDECGGKHMRLLKKCQALLSRCGRQSAIY